MRRLSIALVPTVAVLATALAGCSATRAVADLDAGSTSSTATLGVALPPDRALAALPADAGRVVSVVERRSAENGLTQTITLTGDAGGRGDDRIEVTRRKASQGVSRNRIDAETIEAEMAEALPGVAMTVSSRVVTTPTGPVGVATGPSGGGVNCLYAWSNTKTRGRSTPTASFLGLQIATVANEETTVRVRLCRRGYSDERLIALAEGLRLRVDGLDAPMQSTASVGGDALASAGYGGGGEPVLAAAPAPAPVAAPAPHRVAARAPAGEPTARRPAVAARPAAEPPRPAATVSGPIPLPSGG